MEWDDQLESELKRMDCKGFREGFAGRTMDALNRSIETGEEYQPMGIEAFIGAGFKRVAASGLAMLLLLVFLTFGINYENNSTHTQITTEENSDHDWLDSVDDQLAAGIL